jgi:chromosome segregation ATPase
MPRLGDEGTQPQPGSEPEPIATVPEPTANIQQMQELTQTLNDLLGQLDRLSPETSVDEAIQYALSQAPNDALQSRHFLAQEIPRLRELQKRINEAETRLGEAQKQLRAVEGRLNAVERALIAATLELEKNSKQTLRGLPSRLEELVW